MNEESMMHLAFIYGLLSSHNNELDEIREVKSPEKTMPMKRVRPPKGCQEFLYEDGFRCYARFQETADKKHAKWLKRKEVGDE